MRSSEKRNIGQSVEKACAKFYASRNGRPSLAPGIYFRLLLLGYFEGMDSERGIAWRAADSLGLRRFLGIALDEKAPDHSTISRTRRLIGVETHRQVFFWVLGLLADRGLLKGKRIGIDATTLEANAALRSIVRRDNGESYEEFLTGLAKESGIETPTREDLGRVDRKRKKKKTSNRERVNPHDRDARIAKMKDGRTHLAHKAEHAVDMETGAVVAVTLQEAHLGDTTTVKETLAQAGETVAQLIEREVETAPAEEPKVNLKGVEELVADKGYHSGPVLEETKAVGVRTYIPERQQQGRRHWSGKEGQQRAVYENRRRVQRAKGKQLWRQRGELIERSFAHCYDTGGMRRTHLRKHSNILKRQLIHVGAFNLSLILRKSVGAGTPREWRNHTPRLVFVFLCLVRAYHAPRRLRFPHGSSPARNPRSCGTGPAPTCRPRNSEVSPRAARPGPL